MGWNMENKLQYNIKFTMVRWLFKSYDLDGIWQPHWKGKPFEERDQKLSML